MAAAHPYTYTYTIPNDWKPNTASCDADCATPLTISVLSFTPLMSGGV